MFTGHYAPALALHRRFPEVALWKLFLGVQAVDVLFWALAVPGVERMHIDPSQAGPLALVLEYMPISHSLAATLGWAGLVGLSIRLVRGAGRGREALAVGLAVGSHWFCDLPMHLGDLPIATSDGPKTGFGLWAHPVAAWAFECGLLALSAIGVRRRVQVLVGALLVIQTVQTFLVPLPTSVLAVAAMSEASYLGFAAAAWWIFRQGGGKARSSSPAAA
jgi:hypothetical protein